MLKLLIIIIAFFSKLSLAQVNVNSIIKLNENIPEECGLRFMINNKDYSVETSITIKKLKSI